VVVHCAAGKDRTGIVVALLLSLLGVDDATVAEDYALSTLAMGALRARAVARAEEDQQIIRSEELLAEIFSAHPSNIAALFATLRAEYGSLEEYVVAAGVRPEALPALREGLLEDGAVS
jgi:protein-tyrosine phosphatase